MTYMGLLLTPTILAVSPGARTAGVAVVRGPQELRRFEAIGLRTHTTPVALAMLRRRLDRIVAEERPAAIAVERLSGSRRTLDALEVERTVHHVAALHGICCEDLSLVTARRTVATGGPATRIAAHRALASRFPQLSRFTRQPLYSKFYGYADQYWERSFAALTLAVALAVALALGEPLARCPREADSHVYPTRP